MQFSIQAFSCSCREIEPISETAVIKYAIIFKGKVVSVKEEGNHMVITFNIEKLYKGEWKDSIVSVKTAESEAACGLVTIVGQEWLLYAIAETGGLFWTSTCHRSLTTDEKEYWHYDPHRMKSETKFLEKRKGNN